MLQYQLTPGPTYVEQDTTVLLENQAALKDELRNWEYVWFVVKDPTLDAALERLIGGKVTARVFRINISRGNITFEPVTGIFAAADS